MLQRIFALLLVISIGFATAPNWIQKGVEVEYKAGKDTVLFNVTQRSITDIKVDITTAGKTRKASHNASGISWDFWFDNAKFSGISKNKYIENEYKVTEIGTMTFLGEKYDTVTLETTLSGAKTTRIYDKNTGLMLKQTVLAEGAPVIELIRKYIPSTSPTKPVVTPEKKANESIQEEKNSNSVENDITKPEDTHQPTDQQEEIDQPKENSDQPQIKQTETPDIDEKQKKSCCAPAAILLVLIGAVVIQKLH